MGDSRAGFLMGDSGPDTLMHDGARRARTAGNAPGRRGPGAGMASRIACCPPRQMTGAKAANPCAAEPRVFIGNAVANWPSVPIRPM
jgi:hypothetical protein